MLISRLLFLFLLMTSFASSLPFAFAGTEGTLSGSLLDSDGVAIPNATIELLGRDGKKVKATVSSATGSFDFFPVEAGDYELSVKSGEGQAPFHEDVHVSSGTSTLADIQLPKSGKSPEGLKNSAPKEMLLEVKAKKNLIQHSSSLSRTEMNQEQIKQLPQGSEVSLPKLIANTSPGVVQGPFGQMFIRGNHANIQYQIDGVQLPESPSNTFGQALSPRNIDHMEVITGGIPAEYGQRLGAVVNIITKSGPETPGGELELNYGSYNTTSPHLLYGGSNESGNLHYFVSLNYNRTDRGLDTPQPEGSDFSNQKQGGTDSIHNQAYGNSEFAKVDWQVDNSNKLSFTLFNSQSHYQIPNFPSSFSVNQPLFSTPEFPDQFGNAGEDDGTTYNYVPSNTDGTQSETNLFGQVVWKHSFSPKSFLQVAPYYKYSQIIVTGDPQNDLYTAPGGANPITGANPTSFAENRHVNNLGLKTDYLIRPSDSHLVKTGFQTQVSRADGGFSVQRSLDGSIPSIQNSDPTTGYFEGIYVQDSYTISKSLTLDAGLRFDATQFQFSGVNSNDSMLQPRVGLSFLATDTTKLHVFYGRLFQPSQVENLRTTFNAVNPQPEPYDIKAEKSDYFETGVSQQFLQTQLATLNVYYKNAQNMLDEAQLLNTSIAQPYNYADGYSYGVEFSVRGQVTQEWSEYFNYSYNIAKGRGLSGGAWASDEPASVDYQFLDHVQVHTANAGLTYSKNSFWWSGQGVFGSGLRTGHEKEISLPSHFTYDTTVGYEFKGDTWLSRFRLSADVLNILDNRYAITIANGFNGSHYAAGRQYFLRLTKLL